MITCSPYDKFNEKWMITDDDQIRHIETDMCLDHKNLNLQEHLVVRHCDTSSKTQKWAFSH